MKPGQIWSCAALVCYAGALLMTLWPFGLNTLPLALMGTCLVCALIAAVTSRWSISIKRR